MERKNGKVAPLVLILVIVAKLAPGTKGKTLKYQVYEEQKVGTVIARLKDDVSDALASAHASAPGPALRFRAMQRGTASALSVREHDGEISVRSRLDREKLCEKNINCTVEFDVLTLPTEHLQLYHVEVEVLDVNDNAPRFTRAVVPIDISETAAVGTRVPLDSATDPDVGENGLASYSLSPSDAFDLEVGTRPNGARFAELVVRQELDRETRDGYELLLTAADGGVPQKSGTALLKISITDSNDNNPAFEETSYVVDLPENSPPGTLIVDLNATDPDEGTNGKIVYSFSGHVSPKIAETFKINPDSGHVTLLRKVDFEAADSYDIDVQAQDLGPNSMPAHCKIVVRVTDVNDNRPEVSINLMTPGNDETAYVSEAAPADTFVALVRVDDMDSGANGEVVCRLHGQGHFRLQKTHEKNYMILTNTSLDREKRAEYSLTVVAEDRGTPSLSTVKHFSVQVQDINDNAPRFERSRYEIFKEENNSPGAYLATLQASDPDLGTNGQVSYSILESTVHGSSISTYVTVDPSTGALYALRTFDHEDVSHVSFHVQARDSGTPSLSSNVTVALTVLDENDNRPVILSPPLWNHTADVPVSRYSEAGEIVTVVRATDLDTGANGDLVCSIVAGNDAGYFSVDARTCEIRTNVSMPEVSGDRVDLTVLVQDQGTEPLGARALLRLTLYENLENLANPQQTGGSGGRNKVLDASMIVIISLGAVCGLLLLIMVAFALRCSRDRKDPRTYNCRVAESNYQQHPRKPSRQLHKGDITLVPTSVPLNGTLPGRAQQHQLQLQQHSPGPERAHQSHQSLNSLITISSNHIPESYPIELTHVTPPVEQVSQLLSLLHQGQCQPRPSFRGNKYSRSYRYALQDMDKFSLKDSGRGDSDVGDSDCEMGRDSPIDRLLLGDGFGDLFHVDAHNRLHPAGTKLCTDECRVLGHSDHCWMPPVSSADYRANMFIPGEESRPRVADDDQQSLDSNRRSFSTFGKDSEDEEGGGGGGASSLLSEMSTVFQRLLPTSYSELPEPADGPAPGPAPTLEPRKGFLPGKAGPASSGSASSSSSSSSSSASAAAHFQNPGCVVVTGSAQIHSKWLPAMEEIPENYEEDEAENTANYRHVGRPHVHAHPHVLAHVHAEVNVLLQDVNHN